MNVKVMAMHDGHQTLAESNRIDITIKYQHLSSNYLTTTTTSDSCGIPIRSTPYTPLYRLIK